MEEEEECCVTNSPVAEGPLSPRPDLFANTRMDFDGESDQAGWGGVAGDEGGERQQSTSVWDR